MAAHLPASAAELKTKAPRAILLHANANAVLFQKNADQLMPPSSMSKLMTMIMVFDALKNKDLSLEDELYVSEKAWKHGGSRMFVKVGTSVKVEDLVQGVIVQSGNDAEEAFAAEMNARAAEMGLTKSNFTNSTGWPDPNHRTTARELAMLARHIINSYPEYYHYYSQKQYKWNDITQRNRNPLLGKVEGVDGLKTGYTSEAGFGLVASAVRGGQRLILVMNGLKTRQDRATEGRTLLEWGCRAFKPYTLFDAGTEIGKAAVWGGTDAYVPVVTEGAVTVMLTRPARRNITAEIVYTGPVDAPIRKGQEVAKLRLKSVAGFEAMIPLLAKHDVETGGLLTKAFNALKFMVLGG